MSLILLGALLVFGGVVLLAARVIRQGPLSSAKRPGGPAASDTLEPARQGSILDLSANWAAYGLIALGAFLLLAGAM
jgi:hypothetical protein